VTARGQMIPMNGDIAYLRNGAPNPQSQPCSPRKWMTGRIKGQSAEGAADERHEDATSPLMRENGLDETRAVRTGGISDGKES